jgi:anaerobic selenocysteine-containing dehydrogenase
MCGIEVTVEDKQILSIKGDRQNAFSQGYVCPKASSLKDLYEDPDRLKKPIRRTDDGWQEIEWDQAFDWVAQSLHQIQQNHGDNAVGIYLGNPNAHNLGSILFGPLFYRALRTRNRFSATSVDQLPHHVVSSHLFGHQMQLPIPDIDNTDCFVFIGGNPLASNGSIMSAPNIKARLKAIQKRGGKVIVVDPKCSETAEICDQHYFIRPGSDALLLLAMLHLVFKKGYVNLGHLQKLVEDVASVADYVAPYSPQKVSEYVGIDAAHIKSLVETFCRAKHAVCYGRMGASVQSFGTLTQYLIVLFNMVTGNLDRQGGMMFTQPAADTLGESGQGVFGSFKTRVRQLPSFGGEVPVAALSEEILTPGEGQIKAMLVGAGNPVLSTPQGRQLGKALESLDFFVSIDFYRNETNRHADVILPPVTPLQRQHYDIIFHKLAIRNTATFNEPVIQPENDELTDWQIYLSLAERLDALNDRPTAHYQNLWQKTPRGLVDEMLRNGRYAKSHNLSIETLLANPHGVDLGALQSNLPEALFTQNKKIQLHLDYFMEDLKRLDQHFFNNSQQHKLLLIGRRHLKSNNSWLHNNARMVRGNNRCTAQIHPDTAKEHNVKDQQPIRVASRVGAVELEAEITDKIMPGVVSIPHGWGHDLKGTGLSIARQNAGVSCNDLTDASQVDPLCGNAVLNGVPIEICPV